MNCKEFISLKDRIGGVLRTGGSPTQEIPRSLLLESVRHLASCVVCRIVIDVYADGVRAAKTPEDMAMISLAKRDARNV